MQRTLHNAAAGQSRTTAWMGAALAVAVVLGAVVLLRFGTGTRGTLIALKVTARWSYCLFWPAYAGGALAATFGPRFQPLARRGRDLGLAFASAHTVHILLVVWLYAISPKPPLPLHLAIYFGIGLLLMYLLALFSVPSLSAKLPPPLWRALRIVGMEYIALAFLRDFLQGPFDLEAGHLIAYVPFALLGIGALLLRLAGYAGALPPFSRSRARA